MCGLHLLVIKFLSNQDGYKNASSASRMPSAIEDGRHGASPVEREQLSEVRWEDRGCSRAMRLPRRFTAHRRQERAGATGLRSGGASVERDGGRREEAAECVAASSLGEAISALWPGKYHFAIILVVCAQGVTLCFREHVAAALRRRGGNPAPVRRLLTAALFAVCTLNVSRLVLALA